MRYFGDAACSFKTAVVNLVALFCVFLGCGYLFVSGNLIAQESKQPSQQVAAERPNIVLIMVDDLGFSDLGFQGGEIESPNLDALAKGGVRFSQFYNSGRCCPTRATLMTGLPPHLVGIGHMTNPANSKQHDLGVDGYRGFLNDACVTTGEVLKEAGYATMMTGKWHLGYDQKECWPLQRGFEKYYGCIEGATRYFHPNETRGMTFGNEKVKPESTTSEAFYTTDAFTDYAIRFVGEHLDSDRKADPFFLYLAYTAPHWPLQAFEDDIAKYRGKYKLGWDALRSKRYAKQIEIGLIDSKWPLSPRTENVPAWDSLSPEKQDEMDLKMAVYAAMVDRVDQRVGSLVQTLKDRNVFDNTLIIFLADNGGCQEGGILGRGEFYDVEKRNQQSDNSYGEAWANASNTPFRLYKHFVHEGGSATPFFMHWPAGIKAQENWYQSPAQLIDIMPTLIDLAGAQYPKRSRDLDIPPLPGISLRPAFDSEPLERPDPIFLEHENNASVRDGDWKLVGRGVAANSGVEFDKWELYNIAEDRTELRNLALEQPDRTRDMAAQWLVWANANNVYPKVGKSDSEADKADPNPPQIANRALTITATIRNPKPTGVVISHGGLLFGYSLHFVEGRPAFSIRNDGELTEIAAEQPVKGKVTVVAKLNSNEMSIEVDGKIVASGASPGLIKNQPALGLYRGFDFRDPIGSYKSPNTFNGRILSATVEVAAAPANSAISPSSPKIKMRSPWGEKLEANAAAIPWTEYPRPNFRRDQWLNLNGQWDYAVTPVEQTDAPTQWEGKIRVPFAIESPLSGVERSFTPSEALWYHRTFVIEKKDGEKSLLNFEAVDYESTVWVNGTEVGSHKGGNLPFSFDITNAVVTGENKVVLQVKDATDTAYQLHGKQRLKPEGIWYTPVSGIWQTVWLEHVPADAVSQLKITPSIQGSVAIDVTTSSSEVGNDLNSPIRYKISLGGKLVKEGEYTVLQTNEPNGVARLVVEVPDPQLWSPDSPTLYDLELEYGNDRVTSYFGIRESNRYQDDKGHWRLSLNGKESFQFGTLDQGWWPDGLLTPPSDEAMLYDIQFLKEAGFNTIRKHIKVEPRRYYYHCDRLGIMLWQDQVSSMAENPPWTRLDPNPKDPIWPPQAHEQFMAELKGMMDQLHNHPSVVQWVPFNEAWGQHQTVETGDWTVSYDPTRIVNVASGGNFLPSGHVVDHHQYPHPGFPFELGRDGRFDGFIKIVGEFGGHGYPVEGHLWSTRTRNWGYGSLPKDRADWISRYRESIRRLAELRKQGIAAGIYTQTTDVEGEINGLLTYDRRVIKLSADELRAIHAEHGFTSPEKPKAAPKSAMPLSVKKHDKTNLVVFLSDDHTWRDSSLYGSPDIRTPNMDRIAATGMTFENAYVVSPSCAPSRAALLTGVWPSRSGAEANHSRPDEKLKRLPVYLQELGYEVVSFGKVGHYKQTSEYGFDSSQYFNYHEDIAVPEALDWLKDRESDKPLCLIVGTNWPHVPWPKDDVHSDIVSQNQIVPPNHIDTEVTKERRARYVAAIRIMDDELGQVFDLAREKLGENTLFLHTSDHGAQWPFGKWTLYDDGIRTPLIASWPNRIAGNVRTNAMVSWIDILPTLIEVAGGPKHSSMDGKSFLNVLHGKTAEHRDFIFATHSGDGDNNVYPTRAVVSKDGWKYIRNLHPEFAFTTHITNNPGDTGYWPSWAQKASSDPEASKVLERYLERPSEELYYIPEDNYEKKNLATDASFEDQKNGLSHALDEWMKETGDPQKVFGKPRLIKESR